MSESMRRRQKSFFEIFNKHLGRQIDALLAARCRPSRPNLDPYTGRNRPFSCFKFKKILFSRLGSNNNDFDKITNSKI